MRFNRPSGKAVLAAGAIAVTLVVVATSGAVAGALITSQDIKDNTIKSRDIKNGTIQTKDIKAGSVTWEQSLSQATKDLIEGLAQSGAAGPPGAQGPAGPAGPPGPAGPAGSDATGGRLVAWDYFNGDLVYPDGPLPIVDLVGKDAPITLSNPGSYVVTMRAGASIPELDVEDPLTLLGSLGLLTLGQPITLEEGEAEGPDVVSIDTEVLSRSCLNLVVMCNATFSVTVEAGEPVEIDPRLITLADPCVEEATSEDADCRAPIRVKVEVYQMPGATPAWGEGLPVVEIPLCACDNPPAKVVRKEVRGLVKQLAK